MAMTASAFMVITHLIHAPLMHYMLKTGFEYFFYMVIIKRIINGFACTAGFHKPRSAQNAKLMRNCTLTHPEMLGKMKNAHFARCQRS